jgi:hypothetical protein
MPTQLFLDFCSSVAHSRLPRLFSLIIGINQYQWKEYFFPLRGAVPDGKAFRDYLIKRLGVPEDQIFTLFDEQATRSAIIRAFQNLSEDDRIKEHDPIFIFYAGHGSQKPPHLDWENEEINAMMEVIIPYDCTPDQISGYTSVQPIPDRTIGTLVDEIASRKGDNIVSWFRLSAWLVVLIQIKIRRTKPPVMRASHLFQIAQSAH